MENEFRFYIYCPSTEENNESQAGVDESQTSMDKSQGDVENNTSTNKGNNMY